MKNFLLSIFMTMSILLIGQSQSAMSIRPIVGSPQRTTLQTSPSELVGATAFFNQYASNLGLSNQTEMKAVLSSKDKFGYSHYKFQQFFRGIEVLGANYLLHEKDGQVLNGNGVIMPEREIDLQPSLSETEASQIAVQNAEGESGQMEVYSIKLAIVNSHYPEFDGEFELAYVLTLNSISGQHDSRKIILNAHTGNIIRNYTLTMTCFQDKGKIETLYHGEHEINAERKDGVYYSQDLSRGNGIFVTNKSGKLYTDDDNYWQSGSADYKNGAYDLFWGLQKTYDFYKSKFGRNGADGANLQVKAFLLDTESYVNAFWQPNLLTLNFGIGDFNNYKPLTAIDVVGHEFTHGVTQFSAGLEYLYEAGAINEAFSDILGKTIEHEFDRDSFNWYIGARFAKTRALAFRSMEDPNLYNNAKFYKGKKWVTGTSDNGGVHSNSGVLNYWFYLLCTGLKDTNEANVIFDVKGLGFDTASLFAYTLLTGYLGNASNYYDTREASLLLAGNWWGVCSAEYLNIAEAWKAVGVGNGIIEGDIQLINPKTILNACKDGYYTVESRINNQSCNREIPIGTEINMYFKYDTFPAVKELFVLDKPIASASHINYVFKSIPKIIRSGQTRLTVWMESQTDADTSNNRYSVLLNKLGNSIDHDFKLNSLNISGAPCPNEKNEYRANLNSSYNGCTVIPPGSDFALQFIFKDSNYTYKFKNPTSVYPQNNMTIPNIIIPRSFLGLKKVQLNLIWLQDTLLSNNKISSQLVMIDNRILNVVETFEQGSFDSSRIQTSSDSFNIQEVGLNAVTTSGALVMTGGKILNANGSLIPRVQQDVPSLFQSNAKFTSKVYMCADIAGAIQPKVEFDLALKRGSFNWDSLGISGSAAVRLIMYDNTNAIQLSRYYSTSGNAVEISHVEELIPERVSFIEITSLCLQGGIDSVSGKIDYSGDVVIIDNAVISSLTSVNDNSSSSDIEIYPNPFQESFEIQAIEGQIREIQVLDMMGRIVDQRKLTIPLTRYNYKLESKGSYILKCKLSDGRSYTKKLINLE